MEAAARDPPLKLIVDVLAVAVAVPPQVFVKFGVAAIRIPPGRTSVKLIPVRALAPAVVFAIVKVNVLVLPTESGLLLNDFEIVGGGGLGQPEMITLSIKALALAFCEVLAPVKYRRK